MLAVGTEGWPPFLVGICAFIFCGACLALVLPRLPKVDEAGHKVSVMGFMPLAWQQRRHARLGDAVMRAVDRQQRQHRLLEAGSHDHGGQLLSAMVAGNIAMQVPLGLLAERLTARLVRFLCVLLTLLGCVLLPLLIETPLIWPCVFIWGAVSYGIYTMSIIELGERFTGSTLVAGNATFSLMWGVGGILVPPLTGGVMDMTGASGLPVTLGAICAALAVATVLRRRVT